VPAGDKDKAMHGVINHSLECFLRDTYGTPTWDAIAREAGLALDGFEAMLVYDDALTDQVIVAAAELLRRPRETLLEDLGTYLVTNPSLTYLRRLLRFSGQDFAEFVNSLEDLPGRARLVLPELEVPELELTDHGGGRFTLRCRSQLQGAAHVLVGLLRSMADDYGALVLLDWVEDGAGDGTGEAIAIQVADQAFAAARPFHLGQVTS
jgi:Haem-NO-binding